MKTLSFSLKKKFFFLKNIGIILILLDIGMADFIWREINRQQLWTTVHLPFQNIYLASDCGRICLSSLMSFLPMLPTAQRSRDVFQLSTNSGTLPAFLSTLPLRITTVPDACPNVPEFMNRWVTLLKCHWRLLWEIQVNLSTAKSMFHFPLFCGYGF